MGLPRLRTATLRFDDAQTERIWAIASAHQAGLSIRKIAGATGLSSSHSSAYSTRPVRRLTGPRSSCASASAADREDCAARLVRDLRFDAHRRKGRPGDVPIPYAELEQLTCAEIVTVQPLDVVDVRGDCPIKMGIPTDAVRAVTAWDSNGRPCFSHSGPLTPPSGSHSLAPTLGNLFPNRKAHRARAGRFHRAELASTPLAEALGGTPHGGSLRQLPVRATDW